MFSDHRILDSVVILILWRAKHYEIEQTKQGDWIKGYFILLDTTY